MEHEDWHRKDEHFLSDGFNWNGSRIGSTDGRSFEVLLKNQQPHNIQSRDLTEVPPHIFI